MHILTSRICHFGKRMGNNTIKLAKITNTAAEIKILRESVDIAFRCDRKLV